MKSLAEALQEYLQELQLKRAQNDTTRKNASVETTERTGWEGC
jgi:hypothetical protein